MRRRSNVSLIFGPLYDRVCLNPLLAGISHGIREAIADVDAVAHYELRRRDEKYGDNCADDSVKRAGRLFVVEEIARNPTGFKESEFGSMPGTTRELIMPEASGPRDTTSDLMSQFYYKKRAIFFLFIGFVFALGWRSYTLISARSWSPHV